MQRLETLRASTRAFAASNDRSIAHHTEHHALERAIGAALERQHAEHLSQLLDAQGREAFAHALDHFSAPLQVTALSLLGTEQRAAVYRHLTQNQRRIWQRGGQAGNTGSTPLFKRMVARCRSQWQSLRTAPQNRNAQR